MTIACCLVVPEGVIFASDSTVSEGIEGRYHYLNHNQKIYELGENATVGVMTWGLSALRTTSHRTVIARTSDAQGADSSLRKLAEQLAINAWNEFQDEFRHEISEYHEIFQRVSELARKGSGIRSKEDDDRLQSLQDEITFGYCIGGHLGDKRVPEAYHFEIDPTMKSPPSPYLVQGSLIKGQPEFFHRLYFGHGMNVLDNITKSGLWSGTDSELGEILNREFMVPPELTIRDAIDFAHFIVYSTIKTIKFSDREQVCGGPIEVAAITTDRKFRWVRHKDFDSAIGEW